MVTATIGSHAEVKDSIKSPFIHGDFKPLARYRFAQTIKESCYDRAILLTNSLKSSLIPFFADIPIRTGWLGEVRYGLVNDIRVLDENIQYLMIEKFSALSINKIDYQLANLSFPSLAVDSSNQALKFKLFNINPELAYYWYLPRC